MYYKKKKIKGVDIEAKIRLNLVCLTASMGIMLLGCEVRIINKGNIISTKKLMEP